MKAADGYRKQIAEATKFYSMGWLTTREYQATCDELNGAIYRAEHGE